jgi:hypothetical protein
MMGIIITILDIVITITIITTKIKDSYALS